MLPPCPPNSISWLNPHRLHPRDYSPHSRLWRSCPGFRHAVCFGAPCWCPPFPHRPGLT